MAVAGNIRSLFDSCVCDLYITDRSVSCHFHPSRFLRRPSLPLQSLKNPSDRHETSIR